MGRIVNTFVHISKTIINSIMARYIEPFVKPGPLRRDVKSLMSHNVSDKIQHVTPQHRRNVTQWYKDVIMSGQSEIGRR